MLEIGKIRSNKEDLIERLKIRNVDATENINNILELDNSWRKSKTELDLASAEMNKLSKEIGMLFKSGKVEEANTAKAKTADLKEKTHQLKEEVDKLEQDITNALYQIPNAPNAIVPTGNTDEDNEVVFENDVKTTLQEGAKAHWDLIEDYDLIDFKLGVKVTGSGFPVYKGKGAKLQRGLINFFLNEATDAGYNEYIPPLLINEASGIGTGQLPDKEGQMYHATADDLYLIPTAEVPLTNMYRGDLLKEQDLPIKITGYTPCFRREAGAWGSHVRGLNRLHQFDKVEIVEIQHPEKSYEALDRMVNHIKSLLEKLGLQYRILRLCGGDLGFTAAITYDFEVYSAAQERWLEVSSVSNFETFQANRMKLRFKDSEGKKQLVHTLNGSALALPRIVAALLENNQTENGINIPEALVPYVGFDKI